MPSIITHEKTRASLKRGAGEMPLKYSTGRRKTGRFGARFGPTAAEVQEYLGSQYAMVEKLMLMARERALRSVQSRQTLDDGVSSSNSVMSFDPLSLGYICPPSAKEGATSCVKPDGSRSVRSTRMTPSDKLSKKPAVGLSAFRILLLLLLIAIGKLKNELSRTS